MSEKKHVFKIVPGESFGDTNGIPIFEKAPRFFPGDRGYKKHSEYNLARVNLEPLDNESKIELSLPLQICQIKESVMGNRLTKEMSCLKENGKKLNLCTIKQKKDVNTSDKDYAKVKLEEVLSPVKGKNYLLSIFDKESGECCIKSKIRTDSSFDFESAKRSLSGDNDFSILSDDACEEMSTFLPKCKETSMEHHPFVSIYDQAGNKIASIPGLSLAYFNGNLVDIKVISLANQGLCVYVTPRKYEYITLESSGDDYQFYLSDSQGNRMEDEDSQNPFNFLHSIVLNNSVLYNDYSNLKEVTSSDTFTKFFIKGLNDNQLQKAVPELNSSQLQIIAKNLTDEQFKAFTDDLTNPQLQILAHNMSDQQFADLLNELAAESIKGIINKLPYEKVTAVVGDSGKSDVTVDSLKEKLKEQNEKMKELMDKIDTLLPEQSEANWDNAYTSTYAFQNTNTELTTINI